MLSLFKIRKVRSPFFAALLVVMLFPALVSAQGAVQGALRDLDAIWGAVWDEYADPFFNGVDWHRLPDSIRPRILAAETEEEAYMALADMVAALGDPSTFLVEPNPYFAFFETEYAGIGVLIGLASSLNAYTDEPSFSDEEIAVLEVFPGTPAEVSGVLVGDVIVRVDDWDASGASVDDVSSRIRGPVGTPVELTLRAPDGELRTVTIVRERVDLRPTTTFERFDDDLAYLRLDTLLSEQVAAAKEHIASNADVKHLILDLRGITSGEPVATSELASWFLGNVSLGAFESRYDRYALQAPGAGSERLPVYKNKLTVLIHGGTSGLGEVLALLLSEYNRATLAGQPSAGGFSLTRMVLLPSGWGLNLSIARYVSPGGRGLHAEGLVPDVLIEDVTLEELRSEGDPVLNKVLAWARSQAE